MSSALAQRQWRQKAQTAVRRAVTAAKEARSRFQVLSDEGDAALSDLANTALKLSHLAALRLPGSLADMRPDVKSAAAAKLARQQAAMLDGLRDRVSRLGAAVAALEGAVASLDEVPQDEPWMRGSAVFHTMPLPRVRQLLGKVYDMYRLEYDSKAAVVAALAGLVAGPIEAANTADPDISPLGMAGVAGGEGVGGLGAGGGSRRQDARGAAALAEAGRGGGGEAAAKRLQDLCTTYLSAWMLSPYLEDDQADEALGALSEDMVSF